jgi:signal transduction histidine kinase
MGWLQPAILHLALCTAVAAVLSGAGLRPCWAATAHAAQTASVSSGLFAEADAPTVVPGQLVSTLSQAEFSLAPQGPWQLVSLPDTWAQRGVSPLQAGYYRAHFVLASVPQRALAVRIDRLSRVHEIRVNGHLLQGNLETAGRILRRPAPVLIGIPPSLLKAGHNQLDLVADAGARAGLSELRIGLQDQLIDDFLWDYQWDVSLPQFLNAASAGTALFMAMLWWRRRRDVALGAFAGFSLLASLRNLAYFNSSPIGSTALTDALFFALQAATVVLAGLFAVYQAGIRRALASVLAKSLWAVLLVYAVIGAAASWGGYIQQARAWFYPGLMVVALSALGLVFIAALQRRTRMDALLIASLATVFGAGVHDYLYQQGFFSVMGSFWLPFATPVALLAYTVGLLRQLVDALIASERSAHELEQKVVERTAQLQLANQTRLRYLAAASHDLRQPLVGIGLMGQVLAQQPLPAAAEKLVQRLQRAVEHMDDLFGRLLALARLESAVVQPSWQPVRLQALFESLQLQGQSLAQAKGLKLRIRPTRAVVRADPTLLEQILANLLTNALRYTVRGSVLVAARPCAQGWRIEVRDSGPGIAPDDHARIFEEFVRLPRLPSDNLAAHPADRQDAVTPDVDSPGLGLGLAIAQRHAQLLDSRIGLESAPGCGSRFWLTLAHGRPHGA